MCHHKQEQHRLMMVKLLRAGMRMMAMRYRILKFDGADSRSQAIALYGAIVRRNEARLHETGLASYGVPVNSQNL